MRQVTLSPTMALLQGLAAEVLAKIIVELKRAVNAQGLMEHRLMSS